MNNERVLNTVTNILSGMLIVTGLAMVVQPSGLYENIQAILPNIPTAIAMLGIAPLAHSIEAVKNFYNLSIELSTITVGAALTAFGMLGLIVPDVLRRRINRTDKPIV